MSCLPDQLEPRAGKGGQGRNEESGKERLRFLLRDWFPPGVLVGHGARPAFSAAPTPYLSITPMSSCQETPGHPASYTPPLPFPHHHSPAQSFLPCQKKEPCRQPASAGKGQQRCWRADSGSVGRGGWELGECAKGK